MALEIEFAGRRPVVDPGAFVAPTAVLVGDVTVAAGASVWCKVVLRADFGPIVVNGTSYIDVGAPLTTLYYRINAIDIHANSGPNSNQVTIDHATSIGDTPRIPAELTLLPNTPNPFSGTTELQIGLPKASDAHLEVYDVAGRRVLARDLGRLAAGWRRVDFDGRDDRGQSLSAGVYFYRVTIAGETLTRKMVIAR